MKTKYKYIYFEEGTIETVWLCKNNRSDIVLAQLYLHKQWKQYIISFSKDAVFSADCLTDIADFLEQLNASKKNNIVDGLVMSHLARAGKLTEYMESLKMDMTMGSREVDD